MYLGLYVKYSLFLLDFKAILLITTTRMQRYTIFFISVNAVQVSGGSSAHHQELKNSTHSIWYMPGLLAATASGSSKQACCT
jgi:hypothetical protein